MNNRRQFLKTASALSMLQPLQAFSRSRSLHKVKEGSSFADHLAFVGVAIHDAGYHVWGTSPVVDDKGQAHLFAARWSKAYKVDPGWRSHSEIAHYVADYPEGPFKFSEVALRGTGRDSWDRYGAHNPTIHKVADRYVLLYIGNTHWHQPPHPANQCIGMAIAQSPYGPWEKVNGDGCVLAPPQNKDYWNYQANNGVNNPALLPYKGGFLLYFKSQGARMGLPVAENLAGPYIQLPFPVTQNDTMIEDGYAFVYQDKICLLTTDNHGIIKKGGGILWKSEDSVLFNEKEPGFHLIGDYVPASRINRPIWHYGQHGIMKFERPQLLLKDSKPAYLYVAGGCNIYGGDTTVSYVLKFTS